MEGGIMNQLVKELQYYRDQYNKLLANFNDKVEDEVRKEIDRFSEELIKGFEGKVQDEITKRIRERNMAVRREVVTGGRAIDI